ncbi:MAG: ABC transporter permease [Solirubrobacteraceae bacterium]
MRSATVSAVFCGTRTSNVGSTRSIVRNVPPEPEAALGRGRPCGATTAEQHRARPSACILHTNSVGCAPQMRTGAHLLRAMENIDDIGILADASAPLLADASAPSGAPAAGSARDARSAKPAKRPLGPLLANNVILIALITLVALFSGLAPSAFFTLSNFQLILGSQAVIVMLALAVTVALVANEFDLSVGYVMALSGVLLDWLTQNNGWPLAAALVLTFVAVLAIGALHAFLTVRVGISSFIVTLGSGTVMAGIATRITNSQIITGAPELLSTITTSKVLGVQTIFLFALATALVLWYVLDQTPLGRWTTFVGAGPDVARLSGLPVKSIRAGALISSALIAGIVGVLQDGALGAADPNAGATYLLPSFAAAFLGATTIKPGRFNVWGTVLAVYMVIVGIVGLQVTTGASGWIVDVFDGAVLVVAVAVSRLLGRATKGKVNV